MKRTINSNSAGSRTRRRRVVDSDDYTIPTPSIDFVLQNIASQAVLSASVDVDSTANTEKPVEELECGVSPSSHSTINRRMLLMDRWKDREENVQSKPRANYLKNMRPSRAVARLARATNKDALYRPDLFHEDNSSDSSGENFANIRVSSSSTAPAMLPNRPRIMRNNADSVSRAYANRFSYATEFPTSSRKSNSVLNRSAATNLNSGAVTELNGGANASNTTGGESFTPFCKNCVAEFPRLLKSLENLDSRIDQMSTLMRMALETTRQHGAENTTEIVKSIALFRQC